MQQCNVLLKKKKKVSLDTSEDCIALLEGHCIALLAGHCPAPRPATALPAGQELPCWVHCCFPAHSSRLGSHHLPSWDGGSSCAGLAVNLLYFLFFFKKKPPSLPCRRVQRTIIVQEGLVQVSITSMPWGEQSSPTNTSS